VTAELASFIGCISYVTAECRVDSLITVIGCQKGHVITVSLIVYYSALGLQR
jgi:hypothetical protein